MSALSGSIQLLKKTALEFDTLGPGSTPYIPLDGQPFFVTDTGMFGIGDGASDYASINKVRIIDLTLSILLSLSNTTGDNEIQSNNGYSKLSVFNSFLQAVFNDGSSESKMVLGASNIWSAASGNLAITQSLGDLKILYDAINGHEFSGGIYDLSGTASRVPYLDSNKKLTSSSITPTELGYLSGLASSIQSQLDALRTGQFWKQAVRVATTAAGTLATDFENGDTIDGVVLATGDRILIKDQATGSENGIYVVNASGAPTRTTDFDAQADNLAGATVGVQEGTANGETKWTCSTNNPITVGSTTITFVDAGSTAYTGTSNRITVTGNQIDIAAAFEALLLKAANNLSDIANASTARANLGLTIGTHVQAYSAILAAIAGLSLSNDDILQVKSGAITNRTIAQVRADLGEIFTIPIYGGSLSPADSSTYYFGIGRIPPSATATNHDFSMGFSFKIVGAVMSCANNTVSGSTEDSVLQIRNVTQGTNDSIGNFKSNGSTTSDIVTTFTGLNISVDAADFICARWDTPAYATNPTGILSNLILICKKA